MPTTLTPSVIVSNTSPPGTTRYLTTLSNYKIYKILYSRIFYCSRQKSVTEESCFFCPGLADLVHLVLHVLQNPNRTLYLSSLSQGPLQIDASPASLARDKGHPTAFATLKTLATDCNQVRIYFPNLYLLQKEISNCKCVLWVSCIVRMKSKRSFPNIFCNYMSVLLQVL